jgi:eukaryotic-like serine/threonine-protein kinase
MAMTPSMFRSDCLSEEVVVDLVEGRLAPSAIEQAEHHLDQCGLCSDLVAAAARQLVPPTKPAGPGSEREEEEPSSTPTGYKVVEPLGSGGMGIVYRALRLATGEAVALKTIPIRSADALSAIRREIYSLGRLDHPGVVGILDQGVIAGRPWYAMELIEGDTFEDYLQKTHGHGGRRSLEHGRNQWQKTFEILAQVCDALACLHAHGFVHCDLTPRNIIIRPDGRPVLVDFGLTQRNEAIGRDLLDIVALGGGTVAYMAPEQIRGEVLDPRTDLYAVGCLLYRSVTGSAVFLGSNPLAVLQGHLDRTPVPPGARADGVPRELENLILQLLEKKPQNRLGYADDVASALRALGTGAGGPRKGDRQSYLYRPEFVGRERPLQELGSALDRLATTGRGGRFHIGGESGVGKTRLALEAVRLARQFGLTVVVGHCGTLSLGGREEPPANQGPLHPLASLLLAVADRCRERGPSETERLLGANAKILAAFQPALLDLRDHDAWPEPVALDPQAARARVLSALQTTLFAFADGNPLLLVLDDLQWADELTLSALQALSSGGLEQAGVLLLGTFRLEELTPELQHVLDGVGATYFELPRLEVEEMATMASGMLALREPPPSLVGLLSRYCDGNPFFVAEYLRAAIAAGFLARDTTGRWKVLPQHVDDQDGSFVDDLPLPKTLAALIEQRLSDVGDPAKGIVQAAAVLGRTFDVELLFSTAGTPPRDGLLALDVLNRRQILEEAALGRLRFVHDKIREIAYDRIAPANRRQLHLRAGSLLELRSANDPASAAALGHHYARAATPQKAAKYFALAGDHSYAMHANQEALAYFSRALSLGEDALSLEELAAIQERRGDVLSLVGKRDEARSAFEGALAKVRLRVDKSRLLWKVARTLETEHRHGEALQAYDEAEGVLGARAESIAADGESFEAAWWHQWVQLQVERVWVHYWLADVDAMDARVERARPVIEQHGTPSQRARFFQALVHANMRRERWALSEETVNLARRSLEAAKETNDPGSLAYAQFVLAFQLIFSGNPALAEGTMLEALAGAERIGDLALLGRCLTYHTVLQRLLGNVRDTQAFARRALKAAIELGMHDYRGVAHANLGWAAWREGRIDAAENETDAALSHWATLATKYPYPMQWMARLHAIAIALHQGNTAKAHRHATAILDSGQHRLPDAILVPLEDAIAAFSSNNLSLFESRLRSTLENSRALGWC